MTKCTESESSYMAGCRCDECRKAHTDRERERRAKRRRGTTDETKDDNGGRPYFPMIHDTLTRAEILKARGYDD